MITEWNAAQVQAHLTPLAKILHACVTDGASVGFIHPHSLDQALAFWTALLPQIATGDRRLFVTLDPASTGPAGDGMPTGVVTLITGMPGNQPHRGEVSKLLVHPDHRRKGLARQLMQHLEQVARDSGKTLLTLDTRTGDTAEPLYTALGFETAGVIPNYCLDVDGQRLDATTYMYKQLD